MLGGTQSLHTNSFDEALALPTEEAVRVALRTQQIIAHETGVTNTIDPLGGSYFVETLTDEMEQAAYDYFARIDELGGMVEAIKRNFPQREIADAAFRYQQRGRRAASGSSSASTTSTRTDEEPIEILRIDPALERKQVDRLQATAPAATAPRSSASLTELKRAAATEENLMPSILEAARARATEGEMIARDAGGLRDLHRESPCSRAGAGPLPHGRTATARKIRVVVAKPGLDGHDRGAKIIARALRDAGMEVIYTGLHQTPEQIAETVIQEDADAVGLSILSGAHMTLVPRVVDAARASRASDDVVVTVGGTIPADDIAELKKLGVAEVFTPGRRHRRHRRLHPRGRRRPAPERRLVIACHGSLPD